MREKSLNPSALAHHAGYDVVSITPRCSVSLNPNHTLANYQSTSRTLGRYLPLQTLPIRVLKWHRTLLIGMSNEWRYLDPVYKITNLEDYVREILWGVSWYPISVSQIHHFIQFYHFSQSHLHPSVPFNSSRILNRRKGGLKAGRPTNNSQLQT